VPDGSHVLLIWAVLLGVGSEGPSRYPKYLRISSFPVHGMLLWVYTVKSPSFCGEKKRMKNGKSNRYESFKKKSPTAPFGTKT
jgi:hypothetical protein